MEGGGAYMQATLVFAPAAPTVEKCMLGCRRIGEKRNVSNFLPSQLFVHRCQQLKATLLSTDILSDHKESDFTFSNWRSICNCHVQAFTHMSMSSLISAFRLWIWICVFIFVSLLRNAKRNPDLKAKDRYLQYLLHSCGAAHAKEALLT